MILFLICVWLWWYVCRQRACVPKSPPVNPELRARIDLMNQELEHYEAQAEELQREERALDNKIWWYESHGLPCSKLKENKQKVSQKLWTAQHKVAKVKLTKMSTERKMHNA